MDFQLVAGAHPTHHVLQQAGPLSGDPDGDHLFVVDAVGFGLLIGEVEVPGGDDGALGNLQLPLGAHQLEAGGALNVAGHTDGTIPDAQLHGVGEGQLDLGIGPGGP